MTDHHDMPDDSIGSNIVANWRTARWELAGQAKWLHLKKAKVALLMLRVPDIHALVMEATDPESGMCRNQEEAQAFQDWVAETIRRELLI